MKITGKEYWDNNPLLFRLLLASIGLFFVIISANNFWIRISVATDENIFRDPMSKIYVTKQIDSETLIADKWIKDSIEVGNFLVRINDKKIDSLKQINELIFFSHDTSRIKLEIVCNQRRDKREHYALRKDISGKFAVELKSAVLVTNVIDGGASDRAGVKIGDIITRINGKSFANATEADLIMRSLKANNEIAYEVLRDGKLFKINIRLVKYGVSFLFFIYFLAGFLLMGTGLFFGLSRPRLIAARLTAIALIFIGFSFTGRINPFLLTSNAFHLFLLLLGNYVFLYGIPAFIHSLVYFPVENSKIIKNSRWIIRVPYIISTIVAIPLTYLVIDGSISVTVSLYLSIIFIFSNIIYIIFITRKYRKVLSAKDKKIGRPIMFALNTNLILLGIAPLVYLIFQYSSIVFSYLNMMILLVPLAYIYTVARYRLLDLDLRLNKNNQYLIVVSLFKTLVVFIFFAFLWSISHINLDFPNIHFTGTSIIVLNKPLKPEYSSFYNTAVGIFFSVLFAYLLVIGYKKGINYFNKKYFRTSFDYRSIVGEMSEILENNLSLDKFSMAIVGKIEKTMMLDRAGIILFDENNRVSLFHFTNIDKETTKQFIIDNEEDIFNVLVQMSGSFRVEYLPEKIKSFFVSRQINTIVPMKAKGKSSGMIFLGYKLSEMPINNEDIHFVQSFSAQAMVAIDNLKLYEDLAKKERMKHELELARKIQSSSLPKHTPNIDNIEISSISIPAYEVGGDFYDYLNDGDKNKITIVIGDVSGKGASAALYMSKAQGIIRTLADFSLSPMELLARTNMLLYKYIDKNAFISVASAEFDTQMQTITVARAGHLPVFWYDSIEKSVKEIKPNGLILGASNNDFFRKNIKEETVSYSQGDIFLFATDGAIEARNDDDEFGSDRLKALLSHFKYLAADDLIKQILIEIERFGSEEQQKDDMTLVVVKIV